MTAPDDIRAYVVDPEGKDGAFTSIPEAVKAAKADGATPEAPRYVILTKGDQWVSGGDIEPAPGVYVVPEGTIPP